MAARIGLEVYGVRETIAYLQKFEVEAYKKITKELKDEVRPVADAVGREFPDEPLLNWHSSGGRLQTRSRLPEYNGAKARSSVRPATSTRKPKQGQARGILRLQQMDGGGQVYDSAGSVTAAGIDSMGGKFIMNLDKHLNTKSRQGKYRSRVMYPATEKYLPQITDAVQKIIDDFGGEVQKNINRK
jgi:hypothetical protein